MAEQYIGMSVAVIIVAASIALAGILIGVGRAFGYKRVENFGVEELAQSVINAAIIGGLASVIALMSGISSSLVATQCGTGDAPAQLACTLGGVKVALFSLLQQTSRAAELVGYYQTLKLDFVAFSIQPFANLSAVANILAGQLFSMQLLLMLLELNIQILNFVAQNSLLLLLPVGLVLRTLFATRKAGGFLIALAIGLYIFYPAFVLVFPDPGPALDNATGVMANFTTNGLYATVPVVDLNGNYAIGGKLDLMSGRCAPGNQSGNLSGLLPENTTGNSTNSTSGSPAPASSCSNFTANMIAPGNRADFTGDLTLVAQSNSDSLARVLLYSVLAPLLSLAVTIVFVNEAGKLLGSEIGLSSVINI
jgi:hypothetical protein